VTVGRRETPARAGEWAANVRIELARELHCRGSMRSTILFLSILAGGCAISGEEAPSTEATTVAEDLEPAAETAGARPLALLIDAAGRVEIKRRGSTRWERIGAACVRSTRCSALHRGDLLRAPRGASAKISCVQSRGCRNGSAWCRSSSSWPLPDDGLPWGVANVCG
jgi:hypothetical protein